MSKAEPFDPSAFVCLAQIGRVPSDLAGAAASLPIVVGVWRYRDHEPKLRIDREGTRANGQTFTAKLGGLSAAEAYNLGQLLMSENVQIAQVIASAGDVSP